MYTYVDSYIETMHTGEGFQSLDTLLTLEKVKKNYIAGHALRNERTLKIRVHFNNKEKNPASGL